MSRVTARALEVIRHSLELGASDPAEVGVRLRIAGGAVRPRFVQGAEEGDETVVVDGIRVFISKAILDEHGEVEVDVSAEHDQLIVRPLSSR